MNGQMHRGIFRFAGVRIIFGVAAIRCFIGGR